MIRTSSRSLSDLGEAWVCCGRQITYPADLSSRDAISGRTGWADGEVKGSLFGLGVLLPGKWSCHWIGTLKLLQVLGVSPSCMCVALGKWLTCPSSMVSVWDIWPLLAQLSCFTHQIFGDTLLLLIRSCLDTGVGNLKPGGLAFTFQNKYFCIMFARGDKEASDGGNQGRRFHCSRWQGCHIRATLKGTSNSLLYNHTHSFHFSPQRGALCEGGFSPCHSCWAHHTRLYPAVLPCCYFIVTKWQRSLRPSGDALPSRKLGKLGQRHSGILRVMDCIWKTWFVLVFFFRNGLNIILIRACHLVLAFIILSWKWVVLMKHKEHCSCIQDEADARRTLQVMLSVVLPCYQKPKEGPLIIRNGK